MKKARLLYGCGADSFYAMGMDIPDPFIWCEDGEGRTHAVLSPLEIDRAKKNAKAETIHSMAEMAHTLASSGRKTGTAEQVGLLVETLGITGPVQVPGDFPSALFVKLQALGLELEPLEGSLFPERAIKTHEEIENLRQAQAINEKGFIRVFDILHEADVAGDKTLFWQGETLTSEKLQAEMNIEILRHGGRDFEGGPIVAGGAQGADPHERGHGPLKAGELIIIDSFPQGPSFYYGDLTRTVLKGKASTWQKDIYQTVLDGQLLALSMIRAGVDGFEIHSAIEKLFSERGFATGVDKKGRNYGFFHGTGHALGLEVHDIGDRISRFHAPLRAGAVVTVEPGIYDPDKGGVRIEDVVAVTESGCDNLTTLPKQLEID